MEYYLAIKRDEVLIHARTWMDFKHTAKCKKPVTQDYILFDLIYMKCLGQADL